MILIDWSNVIIGSIMVSAKKETIDEDYVRHLILSSLLKYKKKYGKEYGELVICCDSKSWRKEVFPQYKANRAKSWDKAEIDKDAMFEIINTITEELDTIFPYKVIKVKGAEGDDIIGALARVYNTEKTMIVSADKDFVQLQINPKIRQWSPILKKQLKEKNPVEFLKEHIIRGDKGDGIPNFLSNDTCIVDGIRQKSIKKTDLAKWMHLTSDRICESKEEEKNMKRNILLIDLNNTPKPIVKEIVKSYNKEIKRGDLLSYFIRHKLKYLMKDISSF